MTANGNFFGSSLIFASKTRVRALLANALKGYVMDKLKLTGRNLGRVFNSRLGHACKGHTIEHITKQPNLKLETRPKQLLGSLPLAFTLPGYVLSFIHFSCKLERPLLANMLA